MIDCVAVCGDSFGCGEGLDPRSCFEESFGGLIAKKLGLPLKVYARSGCCNFTIYLQVKKIIDQFNHKEHRPLVLVTLTNHSRLIFPIDSTRLSTNCDISNVDYLSYVPYSPTSEKVRPLMFEPAVPPNLLSETISNMNLCLAGNNLGYDQRFSKMIDRKWKAIKTYFEELYDDTIKREYDESLAILMHLLLREAGLPHVIMGFGRYNFRHIPDPNFVEIHWGEICQAHPDAVGSGHCDENGHLIVAERVLPSCYSQISKD